MANTEKYKKLSVYLSMLLRHRPEVLNLDMDKHGWVSVQQLISAINQEGRYQIDMATLEELVSSDDKGRYRFNDTKRKIKACQGHSIPWVEPELEYIEPPKFLYHGTTTKALRLIESSGHISKMNRHAVHLQEDEAKAWQSAERWHQKPVVLKVDAEVMTKEGFQFGRSDNNVWCVEDVPAKYIVERIFR